MPTPHHLREIFNQVEERIRRALMTTAGGKGAAADLAWVKSVEVEVRVRVCGTACRCMFCITTIHLTKYVQQHTYIHSHADPTPGPPLQLGAARLRPQPRRARPGRLELQGTWVVANDLVLRGMGVSAGRGNVH